MNMVSGPAADHKSAAGIGICKNKSRHLLSTEEQRFSIDFSPCAGPELLNRICRALDRDIGNVVSLICLRDDDTADGAAGNAKHFGLYPFCSAGGFAENDELLGVRSWQPSIEELKLIERATCLAAIAIQRYNEAGDHGNCRVRAHRPVPGYVLEWPCSLN
jgi:hypothetical protein